MTLAHRFRRFRRIIRLVSITIKSACVVYRRASRGGAYVFRDCPTTICVMFARDQVGSPELVDAALAEVNLRCDRRRVRNGWSEPA